MPALSAEERQALTQRRDDRPTCARCFGALSPDRPIINLSRPTAYHLYVHANCAKELARQLLRDARDAGRVPPEEARSPAPDAPEDGPPAIAAAAVPPGRVRRPLRKTVAPPHIISRGFTVSQADRREGDCRMAP